MAAQHDPDKFWAEQAKLIDWQRQPQTVCEYSNPPFATWFGGGTTNLCHNAVDRHLAARPDQAALIAVSTETGLFLHQFKWLGNDDLIGSLPLSWNYLVGEHQSASSTPELIHYTLGGPYFEKYRDCEFADLWRAELARLNFATPDK